MKVTPLWLPLLLAPTLIIACSDDQITVEPTSLCRCTSSEICVNDQCIPIRDARILDAPAPDTPEPLCVPSEVRIEELRHAGNTLPDFVELGGPAEASLDGYRLLATDAAGGRRVDVILSGTLGVDGLWLGALGAALEVEPDVVLSTVGLPASSGSLQLFDCDGRRLDAVGYGDFGAGERFRGEGTPATAAASGESLGRCVGADDSDDNATDFQAGEPTPGAPNATLADTFACSGCDPSTYLGEVWLGELLYDPTGADADDVAPAFVELHGTPDLDLENVVLESWDEPGAGWRVLGNASGSIPSEGRFLIAEDVLTGIDLPNDAGGIRITACGAVLDALVYGSVADPAAAGLNAAELDVPEGRSLSRCPDLAFAGSLREAAPTPGAANSCQ